MKRAIALAAAAAVAIATPALAAIKAGDKAPEIHANAYQDGKASHFMLSQALKKGPVVLYFFPGAFTPGCNVEAQQFAASIDKFNAAGATVVGVTSYYGKAARKSEDKGGLEQAVADFSKEHCNGKFPVAAVDAATVKAYDVVMREGISNRTSFVIGKDGKIAMAHTDMAPDTHIAKTLETVQKLK
jgi:thioredoxin-dependent peroxiredoxin